MPLASVLPARVPTTELSATVNVSSPLSFVIVVPAGKASVDARFATWRTGSRVGAPKVTV